MKKENTIWIAVTVAALGYFVDVFDLILFSAVRTDSLRDLGYDPADKGLMLINLQMAGMLAGGILWGMLGDKKGRLSVLFGSIFLYSFANIANGFVTDITWYGVFRVLAGLGLAGELGAGITLVSEIMSKEKRGIGTMLVATIGVSGAIAATYLAGAFSWRTCYFIGGALGLALLILRISVHESGMFKKLEEKSVPRGSLKLLFKTKARTKRYLGCILMGTPTWFVVGLLITFAPEFGEALGMPVAPDAKIAVRYCYIGLTIGDFVSGAMSQLLRSRKNVLLIFFILTALFMSLYLFNSNPDPVVFYWTCGLLGFGVGFWAILVTVASEQFGTNLRALSATTVPNFARGALVPLSMMYELIKSGTSAITSATIIGAFALTLAFIGLYMLPETYGKDLDYVEK